MALDARARRYPHRARGIAGHLRPLSCGSYSDSSDTQFLTSALNLALLKKCLHDARLLFAAMAALLFAFCWVRVFIVSRLQMSQFATIVEQVWDQLKAFVPVPLEDILSYTGRVGLTYNEPI